MPKRLLQFLLCLVLIALVQPGTALAQETPGVHPWLSDRFQLAVGAFARDQNFAIRADGSDAEEEIDFDETLGVDDEDVSGSLTFRWQFGRKWSLWGQAWKVDSTGAQVLPQDVEFEDLVFREGSFARAGVKNSVARVFFGRKIVSGPHYEFGLGAGFHWLELGAFIEGEALVNDEEVRFARGDVDAEGPLPNIGAWLYYAVSERWLIDARLDWLEASTGKYSGGLWNSAVGVSFQASKHVGLGLYYQYFSLDFDVDKSNWKGGADLRYRGPFLSLTTNW
jgi:hypothetical protein